MVVKTVQQLRPARQDRRMDTRKVGWNTVNEALTVKWIVAAVPLLLLFHCAGNMSRWEWNSKDKWNNPVIRFR